MRKISDREAHMTVVAINYTLSVMAGKWKWLIIGILYHHGVRRYTDLKEMLAACSDKMLSQQLRELEVDGIIVRTSYNEVPPRVEYSITEKGEGVMPILKEMRKWGSKHMEYVEPKNTAPLLDASGNKRKKRLGKAAQKKKVAPVKKSRTREPSSFPMADSG